MRYVIEIFLLLAVVCIESLTLVWLFGEGWAVGWYWALGAFGFVQGLCWQGLIMPPLWVRLARWTEQ